MQERLAAMLAMTGNLDATVTLDIMDGEGHPLASVDVAQFDVALEPDRAHNLVRMPQSSLERLSDGWDERLTVKMLPLWEPATTPIDLVRDPAISAWRVPEDLAPGPWWVLGWDGDWPRYRPLLWPVHGEQTRTDDSELMQAIREPVRERRQERLQALVRALATNTEHPDWPRLFDYLPLTRTYPAGALDLFHHVIHDPEAMIVALLKSTDEEFDLVWSLAERLPFSWHLMPVIGWLLAAERHFGALRAGLAAFDPDSALLWGLFRDFRDRVTSHQPFFKSVCDWIGRQLFPDRPLENSELAMARHHPSMLTTLMQEHEQALQARHDADERYPDGPCVMERTRQPHFPPSWRYERLAQPFRPVRCAPFAAAQLSLDAEQGSEELLLELRQLRDFDPEWFDNAFACALCLGLAQRPVGTERMSL
jgi:hypothetical protein